MCQAHYFQTRRHGHITTAKIGPYRTPGCKEPGCDQPHDSLGWCTMHYTRWRRHGDPGHVGKPDPKPGELNHNWQGDSIGYGGHHLRLRHQRGPAAAHPCQHCGAPARHWAYDHTDPAERTDPATGCPYSTDPGRYIPLCQSCHGRFDREHRKPGQLALW
jgi:hypothetical protein